MKAGIGKVLLKREVEDTPAEGVVWGEIVNLGPGGKLGFTVGDSMAAYVANLAVKVGDESVNVAGTDVAYALEIVAESDILALEPIRRGAEEPVDGGVPLEDTTEGPVDEDEEEALDEEESAEE